MALELVYTSAARGLRPGGGGFCTVAMTVGMPASLVPRLEALSGYRPAPSGANPVAHCFWRVETAAGIMPVLAIVSAAPPDHTARSNKIAAFLVLSADEMPAAGPAWMVARPGLVRRSWSGDPRWIEKPAAVPKDGDASIRRCVAWERASGDAGWAGVVASTFLRDQSWPIHVVYGAETDPLPLVDEVIRLMPEWARWRATFSTYFLQTVAGIPCALRFCLDGTSGADIARSAKGLLIDLTQPMERAPDSRFCRMARTGVDEPDPAARPSGGAAPVVVVEEALGLEELAQPSRRIPAVSRRGGRSSASSTTGSGRAASGRSRNSPLMLAIAMGAVTLLVVLLVAVAVVVIRGSGPGSGSVEVAEPARAATDRAFAERPVAEPERQSPVRREQAADPLPPADPAPPPSAEPGLPPAGDPSPPRSPPPPAPPPPAPPVAAPSEPAPPPEPPRSADPPVEIRALDPAVFGRAVDDRAFLVDRRSRIAEFPRSIASAKLDLGPIPGILVRERASTVEFCSAPAGEDPIALGELEWEDGRLSWRWRRVGTRTHGGALDALGRALAFSEIEVRLQDGSQSRLQPPPASLSARVGLGGSESVVVLVPNWEAPKVAIGLNAQWKKAAAAAGSAACSSSAGTVSASWDEAAGACIVHWTCEELEALRTLRDRIGKLREEQRTRTGKEREVVEAEIAALAKDEGELQRGAAARASAPPSLAPIEVRGRSGRVLARIKVTLETRIKP